MKNIFLLMLFSLIYVLHIKAQQTPVRVVYWLHGLGGDDAAWSQAASATVEGTTDYPSRRIQAFELGYEHQNSSLMSAAVYLQGEILKDGNSAAQAYGLTDRSNNFMIAHSQGGIVARRLDKLYSGTGLLRDVYGIVTFGTPHQGAMIINNIPNFTGFIDAGCNDLLAGPVKEAIDNSFIVYFKDTGPIVRDILSPLCNVLSNAAPLTLSQFTTPITQEFKVGAPEISDLNDFDNNLLGGSPVQHKVAFYGVEDPQTAVWRVLYNILLKKPNEFPAFGADDDSPLLTKVQSNINNYQAKEVQAQNDYYNSASQYCNWLQWISSPTYCTINDALVNSYRNNALSRRDAWQTGVDWWNTAPDRFNLLTGAKSYDPVTVNTYNCNCVTVDYNGHVISQWSQQTTDLADCASGGGNGNFKYCSSTIIGTSTSYIATNHDSDGIVVKESAINYPGVQTTNTAVMQGSNHQQMRNDSNTKARLNELFGGTRFDNYFATPH